LNTLEAIATRRSIRRFKDTPIRDDALQAILTAATQAPSAKNRQPCQFVYEQASLPPESEVFRSFGSLSGLTRLLNSPHLGLPGPHASHIETLRSLADDFCEENAVVEVGHLHQLDGDWPCSGQRACRLCSWSY
jgi:hypothetical protein